MPKKKLNLKSLGKAGSKHFAGLETFPSPEECKKVTCISDEVTAVCPVTGQPDYYKVEITYHPAERCVESKSLKLYLGQFRNKGHFCEDFSDIIANDLHTVLDPYYTRVTVTQKSRGGISIVAVSEYGTNETDFELAL